MTLPFSACFTRTQTHQCTSRRLINVLSGVTRTISPLTLKNTFLIPHTPLSIHREEIKQVISYRYLGIHLDNLLSWGDHVDYVCSRLQLRLYFLRRLRVFGVSHNIMFLFYQAVMESFIRYGMTAWFGNLSTQSKSKLQHLVQTAMKVMEWTEKFSLQSIYEQSVLRQARRVLLDPSNILQTEYELLPSGRRYRIPKTKLNRFKYSFVPTSIKILNQNFKYICMLRNGKCAITWCFCLLFCIVFYFIYCLF